VSVAVCSKLAQEGEEQRQPRSLWLIIFYFLRKNWKNVLVFPILGVGRKKRIVPSKEGRYYPFLKNLRNRELTIKIKVQMTIPADPGLEEIELQILTSVWTII